MKVSVFFHEGRGIFTREAIIEAGDRTIDEALEYAYFRTQNIGGSWSKGEIFPSGERNTDYSPDINFVGEYPDFRGEKMGARSSMVNDEMMIDGVTYAVAWAGFKRVSPEKISA
jgi:hypothetical protein